MTEILMERESLDEAAAEAFAGRVADMLSAGATAAMMSLGHRLGLYDVMAAMAPATSAQIAARAGLAERYVREWLAVMVTARIVLFDPARRHYRLPAGHAASLTRGAPLGNLAVYAQHVALLGAMEPRVIDCFETGGGTTYDDYPCFHAMMAEDSAMTVTTALFDHVIPLAGGFTSGWRRGSTSSTRAAGAARR